MHVLDTEVSSKQKRAVKEDIEGDNRDVMLGTDREVSPEQRKITTVEQDMRDEEKSSSFADKRNKSRSEESEYQI